MRLSDEFFRRDAKTVAGELLGKELVRHFDNNYTIRLIINETEAYVGEHDLACHASKGRTRRTEPMFLVGGILYVYLVYGMHFMLNVVTGAENSAEAVLIRGAGEISGPGKLTKALAVDASFNCESLISSERIYINETALLPSYITTPRIGIDYAGEFWKSQPLRFVTVPTHLKR